MKSVFFFFHFMNSYYSVLVLRTSFVFSRMVGYLQKIFRCSSQCSRLKIFYQISGFSRCHVTKGSTMASSIILLFMLLRPSQKYWRWNCSKIWWCEQLAQNFLNLSQYSYKLSPPNCLILEIFFLMAMVLDDGKNFSKTNLFKSSQLVIDLGAM